MKKSKQIPTIGPRLYGKFLFNNIEWASPFPSVSNLFHINRIEDVSPQINFPLPPHRKVTNDIIFLTRGESTRSRGLTKYDIKKNQAFFLPAFQVTAHDYMSEDAEGFFINYSSEILTDYAFLLKKFKFLNITSHPVVQIPEEALPNILKVIHRMEDIYLKWSNENLDLAILSLLTLMAEINKYSGDIAIKSNKNQATLLTEEYKRLLNQHIYEKQTVQEYADLLYVTPNHLNKCIKITLNKTAKNLLNEMLILECKTLLKYSNLTIAQVAAKICSSSASNFSRFFKKQTGITPKEYLEN